MERSPFESPDEINQPEDYDSEFWDEDVNLAQEDELIDQHLGDLKNPEFVEAHDEVYPPEEVVEEQTAWDKKSHSLYKKRDQEKSG